MRTNSAANSVARQLCEEFPTASNHGLARKLRDAMGNAMTENAAECMIRRLRGALGEWNRKNNNVVAKPSIKSNAPSCPPSDAKPWLPVRIDGPCRVLSISDVHIPYHDAAAVEEAVKHGRKLKPDVVLLNGDTMDFYRGSRFQQDPRKRTLTEEIETGKEFLKWLRGRFPKARIIYKLGNHDERWDVFVWNRAPEIFNLENVQLHNILDFEKHGIERVGDNPILAGKLPILHGHEMGKSLFSPVNPARGAFLRTNHTVLIGHLHRPSSHAEPNMFHDETMTWSQGCLCGLQPEYARINKWAHGFAHVDVDKGGQFNVHNYRLSSDYQVRAA